MDSFSLIVIGIATLVSGILGTTLGVLGGTLLLLILSLQFGFAECMVIHGAIQFVLTFSRTLMFYKYIRYSLVGIFLVGFIGPVFLISLFSQSLDRGESFILVGLFLIVSLKIPIKELLEKYSSHHMMGVVGGVCGIVGPLTGVTGTITAPFFLKMTDLKESYVASKAACQSFVHVSKVLIFLPSFYVWKISSFQLGLLTGVILFLSFVGNLLGSKILKALSEKQYQKNLPYVFYGIAILFILRGLLVLF